MLSLSKLARLAERGVVASFTLFDAVTRNGHPFPVAARTRLASCGDLALAAIGLALQRAVELSYTMTPELLTVIRRCETALVVAFPDDPRHPAGRASLPGVAMALAGMADAIAFAETAGDEHAPIVERAREVASRAASALLVTTGFRGDETDAAIVVWQLAARQEHLGRDARALVAAAEARLDAASLANLPACLTILALRPRKAPWSPRTRRAA